MTTITSVAANFLMQRTVGNRLVRLLSDRNARGPLRSIDLEQVTLVSGEVADHRRSPELIPTSDRLVARFRFALASNRARRPGTNGSHKVRAECDACLRRRECCDRWLED